MKVGEGDASFGGHGPRVIVDAVMTGAHAQSRSLAVSFCVNMRETTTDYTEVDTCSGLFPFYKPAPGECIQSIDIGNRDILHYVDKDETLDMEPSRFTKTFVRRYEVNGDMAGNNEAGTTTGVAVVTEPFSITVGPCL